MPIRFLYYSAIVHCWEAFAGHEMPISFLSSLHAAIDLLPVQAHIYQSGLHLRNSSPSIRLLFSNITPREIERYLVQLGWCQDNLFLFELLTYLHKLGVVCGIGIEVDGVIQPKIGIECFFGNLAQPATTPSWKKFFTYLVEQGLSTPAKGDALLAMPNQVIGFIPSKLEVAIHGINHVKLSVLPSAEVTEAKVYLHHYPSSFVQWQQEAILDVHPHTTE